MANNQKKVTDNAPGLKKQLNPANVWAIAFGCIIGWGSFINPGKKFLPNSGVAGTAIAMVLGGLVMIIIAFSYAYMIPKFPKAGGEFTFTKHCYGKREAYFCGWFLVAAYLTNVPMNSTAIGLIVDGIDGPADILKFGFNYQIAGFDIWLGEIILAGGILLLMGWFNIIGVLSRFYEEFRYIVDTDAHVAFDITDAFPSEALSFTAGAYHGAEFVVLLEPV